MITFKDIKNLYIEKVEEENKPKEENLDGEIDFYPLKTEILSSEVEAEVERFKHIVNKICIFWGDNEFFDEYMNSLFVQDRVDNGGREGFPPQVLKEIHAIQNLHHKLFDKYKKDDIWKVNNDK